jgi:hypothetical protein
VNKNKNIVLLFLIFSFFGCYKNHLYVQTENIKEDFLASYHIGSPDYRKKNPPIGQRLIVSWDFPKSLYEKKLSICLTVRFWNNEQIVKIVPLYRIWGTEVFFFKNKEMDKKKKILTYKVDIITKDQEIIETWEHQFWTELIDVDRGENF